MNFVEAGLPNLVQRGPFIEGTVLLKFPILNKCFLNSILHIWSTLLDFLDVISLKIILLNVPNLEKLQ
jgi:hypothetical protein